MAFIILRVVPVVVFIFISLFHIANSGECTKSFPEWNADFNVCSLKLTSTSKNSLPFYTVSDSRYEYDESAKYKYSFNVANSVLKYPVSCENATGGYCKDYTDDVDCSDLSNIVAINYETWGYRLKCDPDDAECSNPVECKHLSNYKPDRELNIWIYSWIIDQKLGYPTNGIRIDMDYGDYDEICPYMAGTGRNYWFSLILECANDAENIPDTEVINYDPHLCWYWMKMKSIYGCPEQCGRSKNQLCGGHGVCGYDFVNNIPKCMCYHGYSSKSPTDCKQYDKTEGESAGLAAVNSKDPSPDYSYKLDTKNNDGTDNTILYDMSEFHADNSDFKIHDTSSSWVYYVNLADSINPSILPKACKESQAGLPCADFDEVNNKCNAFEKIGYGVGVAFRHNEREEKCELFGTKIEIKLYDESRPEKGITFTTTDGAYCGGDNSPLNVNRKSDLHLVCNNNNYSSVAPPKEMKANIYANDSYGCEQDVWYQTGVACPWNCLTVTNEGGDEINGNIYDVCSSRGTCLFDPYAKMTRCICDTGYEGSNCQTESNSNPGKSNGFWILDNLLLSSIVILLVVVLMISFIFWSCYMKLNKKYKHLEAKQLLINADTENIDIIGNNNSFGDAAKMNDSIDSGNSSNKSDKNEDDDEQQPFIVNQ